MFFGECQATNIFCKVYCIYLLLGDDRGLGGQSLTLVTSKFGIWVVTYFLLSFQDVGDASYAVLIVIPSYCFYLFACLATLFQVVWACIPYHYHRETGKTEVSGLGFHATRYSVLCLSMSLTKLSKNYVIKSYQHGHGYWLYMCF